MANLLPRIEPPDGAPLDTEAKPLSGSPVLVEPPLVPFQPEQPDNALLRLAVADGVVVTGATARISGTPHNTNLAVGTVTIDGNSNAIIDFGRVRPVSSITFLKQRAGDASSLMVQLGGTWILPQTAGTANFSNLQSGVPFPELQASKLLLSNVANISQITSRSFPANVTLRLNDGGSPFFAQPGDLQATAAVVPDFGQPLTQALANSPVQDGRRTVDLVSHSDSFGTVVVGQRAFAVQFQIDGLGNGDFAARTQTLPPGGSSVLNLTVPGGLTRPASGPIVTRVALRGVALGFGPGFTPANADQAAIASQTFELAQAIVVSGPVLVASLLLLAMRRGAGLSGTAQLRADANGTPGGDVLGSATLAAIGISETDFTWVAAAFSPAVALQANQPVWLRVHLDQGELILRGAATDAIIGAARYSTDQGNTWQVHPVTLAFLTEIVEDAQHPPAVRLAAGGQQQTVTLPAPGTSLEFGDADPLTAGLNAALVAGAPSPGLPLPGTVALTIGNEGSQPRQITLTRLDMTLT